MRYVIVVFASALGFGLGILFSQTLLQEASYSSNPSTKREYTTVSICDEVLANLPRDEAEVFTGEPAEVDFSSMPEAYLYRTTIRDQAKEGPNFAGHYTVATWGCGTECEGYAIVDAITGRVVVYESYISFQVSDGVNYNLDGNILTVNPKSTKTEYLESIKGKTVAEVVRDDYEAHKARIYYQLVEEPDGAYLTEICVENLLDGTF